MERDDKQRSALIGRIRFWALIIFLLITLEGTTGVCVCLSVCLSVCLFIYVDIFITLEIRCTK